MKQYIQAEIKEDCILLSLTDQVTCTPRREVKKDLQKYIADLQKLKHRESDVRKAEIEACYGKYAQLILESIDQGRGLPGRKSFSLNA